MIHPVNNPFKVYCTAPGSYLIKVVVNQPYLRIPIQEQIGLTKVSLVVDNLQKSQYKLRLACNKVDYHLSLDLSEYLNQEVCFILDDVVQKNILWSYFSMSDSIISTNIQRFRPNYHFSADFGWINDPNGMFYKDGVYHLCFQYNPYGATWENMTWGHAVSKDLILWQQQKEVLHPDALGQIYSGCAVVDTNNDAGFAKGSVLAYYTNAGNAQFQSLAYSTDNGQSFIKYKNNPILMGNSPDFRDPKVFYHQQSKKWIMVLAAGQQMEFYSSIDLLSWEYQSTFGQGIGVHSGVWECPDLIELSLQSEKQNLWVLLCNINPGGIFGGSAAQYFIGHFDGKTFTVLGDDYPKWLDFGKDFYAGVSWSNLPDNRKVVMAWMSNWQYAHELPSSPFKGVNTIARELSLFSYCDSVYVKTQFVKELQGYCKKTKLFTDIKIDKLTKIEHLVEPCCMSYRLDFDFTINTSSKFHLKLYNDLNQEILFVVDLVNKQFTMERDKSGHLPVLNNLDFIQATTAPIYNDENKLKLQILIDTCSIEIFGNHGEFAMTNLVFPTQSFHHLQISLQQGFLVMDSLQVYHIVV
ncbi:GH32 C-terminal domain-containing protein [Myroides sp. LJL119]